MPSGVTVHAAVPGFGVVGVLGVFREDAVSVAGGVVVDAERDVSAEAPGCVFSAEQPAVAAMRSMRIGRMHTGRSREVESASDARFPCPVDEAPFQGVSSVSRGQSP